MLYFADLNSGLLANQAVLADAWDIQGSTTSGGETSPVRATQQRARRSDSYVKLQ